PDFPQPVQLGPSCTRWRYSEVEAFEKRSGRSSAELVAPPPRDSTKRGSPPGYDWAAFDAVAHARLDEQGAFDPSVDHRWRQASLEKEMADWCRNKWGGEPAESTIRKRIGEIVCSFKRDRRGQ